MGLCMSSFEVGVLTVVTEGAQNLPERQTGESSGEPREKSETRSELENPST